MNSMAQERVAWHPAFCEAIKLELKDYLDLLEIEYEHPLTTEPLKIDVLIIKKLSDTQIDKSIGRIFKAVNVIEYKSPTDYMAIEDYYKVCAYANLYAALNEIGINKMSVTLVGSKYPRKLISHLRNELGYTITQSAQGIYYIEGGTLAAQIINRVQIDEEEAFWLKSLGNDLSAQGFVSVWERSETENTQAKAYMNVIMTANAESVKEANMSKTTLRQVLEENGVAQEFREEGKVEVAVSIIEELKVPVEEAMRILRLPEKYREKILISLQ
jgi:hypothetical protein